MIGQLESASVREDQNKAECGKQEMTVSKFSKSKAKLEEMGMSASDLAEVTGYKTSSIYRLMNTGVKCSGYCAHMVMRELGIKKEDLT